MKRNTVSMVKFVLLCLVFVSIPFLLSWTLNFFFPFQDYPIDYMHVKEESAMFDSQVIDVDQEQNFIHFEENNKEDEDVYDPRIYMFDKNGPVYNETSQILVDYIARHLQVHYDVLNNFAKYYKYVAKLSLKNNGTMAIVAANWSIYLFHFTFIEPKQMKPKHSALVGDDQFNITHIDGSFYKMTPTSRYIDIQPGEVRDIILNNENSMIGRTDALPNWYVCAPDTLPRILVSTQDEDLGFVGNFSSVAKWKRSAADLFDPYTPDKRYIINADAHDHGQANRLIIPTPLNLTKSGRVLSLSENRWSVIYSDDLVMEANLLSGQLDIPVTKTQPSTHFIHIRVGFVSLPSTSGRLVAEEAYTIQMDCEKSIIRITGTSAAGVFYGIQSVDSIYNHNARTIHCLDIVDAPRFAYRGLMLDVARNFFPVYEVIRILDTMAMYKLNVLHLHMSDDQGWRLQIPGLEELTRIGACRNHNFTLGLALIPSLGSGPFSNNSGSGFYMVQDYRMILRHAKSRHIRVIPEFDMPGHVNAALVSMEARYRRLCLTNMEEATKYRLVDPDDRSEYLAPEAHRHTTLNPCMESTYNFVEKVISTLKAAHQDIMPLEFYHLGGDEVPADALKDSPICQRFMVQYPYYNSTTRLREYFVRRVVEIAKRLQVKVQAWEDGLLDDMKSPFNLDQLQVSEIYINLWNNIWEKGRGHRTALFSNKDYKVILSHATHLYFDHAQEPDPEERGLCWARRFISTQKVFSFQPEHIYDNMDEEILGRQIIKSEACAPGGMVDCIPVEKPENIIGMEGHIWSELIRTNGQLESMLFPRMLALAERAWHQASWEGIVDDHVRERLRLEDWESFANSLGHKELSRLEGLKINYYLPPPGAIVTGGMLKVNTMFPGMIVQYSTDNGTTWTDTLPDMKFDSGTILLATRSYNLLRRGRSVPVEIHY